MRKVKKRFLYLITCRVKQEQNESLLYVESKSGGTG